MSPSVSKRAVVAFLDRDEMVAFEQTGRLPVRAMVGRHLLPASGPTREALACVLRRAERYRSTCRNVPERDFEIAGWRDRPEAYAGRGMVAVAVDWIEAPTADPWEWDG